MCHALPSLPASPEAGSLFDTAIVGVDNMVMKSTGPRGKRDKKTSISLDEFKRHTGALLEKFDDGLQLMGEQLVGLEEKFDKKFDGLNAKVDSHTEMTGKLMTDMSIVKGDLTTIKSGLKRKVDYDDFQKLEKRVLRLESVVSKG
jgi:hypothetical protein